MTKFVYQGAIALAACAVLAMPAMAAKGAKGLKPGAAAKHAKADTGKQHVVFAVSGVDSSKAQEITKTLADNGVSAKVHEGKNPNKKNDKGLKMSAEVDPAADLSAAGKAVGAGQSGATLQVVIFANLTKDTGNHALAELEKIKGVDVKHSDVDAKSGELRVAITGSDHVSVNDISNAVKAAGIDGHFARMGKEKST
jgi:hypothetical protein